MTTVNALLDRTFDVLLAPLGSLPFIVSLSIVSLATAIAVLMVVRATSDQRALAAVKRQIQADLFEIRLFNDDLRAMARAQLDILRHNGTYLRLSLVPMLWMVMPLVLLVAQLQSHFGYSGIAIGQHVLITAQVKPHRDRQAFVLDAPPEIHVDTPAIWFPALNQIVWRIVANRRGDYAVWLRIDGEAYSKTVHVSDGIARHSPVRPEPGLVNQALYPSEAPLPAFGPLESVGVSYPERRIDLFGWEMRWMTVYLMQSVIFALLLSSVFHVRF